jgi:hypothetical protein
MSLVCQHFNRLSVFEPLILLYRCRKLFDLLELLNQIFNKIEAQSQVATAVQRLIQDNHFIGPSFVFNGVEYFNNLK